MWNFREQFSPVHSDNLTNFSICSLKSHRHKIIIIQHIYCFLCMVCFFSNPAGPFCTHGRYSNCPVAKDRKTNVIGPFCTHGRCSICPIAKDRKTNLNEPFCTHRRRSICPIAKDRKTNVNGPFCTHGRFSICPISRGRQRDRNCCQCPEWVCKDHCIKTNQIKCDNCKEHTY